MSNYWWVVKTADNSLHTIGNNEEPSSNKYLEVVIAPIDLLTGEPERGEWLQIENIETSPGVFERIATVDQQVKDAILLSEQTSRDDKQAEDDTALANYRQAKRKLKQIKKADLRNAEDIKTAIIILRNALLRVEEKIFNIDENG